MALNCKIITLTILISVLSVDVKRIQNNPGYITFDQYYRYEDIQNYLTRLNLAFSRIVQVTNYGISIEKRNLTAIEISVKGYFTKPLMFVDAGIHAREWISTSFALYLINQLLETPKNYEMLLGVDWLIVPLVNPDGYEYTHTADRFWRKNRRKGNECDGVDLNRNFNFHWSQPGASSSECSNFFAGQSAFSEPESFALSNLIKENAYRIRSYITLHAPTSGILFPWAYTNNLTSNHKELEFLATTMSDTMHSKYNLTRYNVGTVSNVSYIASGTSSDWVYGVANIKTSFVIELKGREANFFRLRFDLPEKDILLVVTEMFEGIKVIYSYVERKYSTFLNKLRRLTLL